MLTYSDVCSFWSISKGIASAMLDEEPDGMAYVTYADVLLTYADVC